MIKHIFKSNINFLLIILTIIGIITGYFYYSIQSSNTKNSLHESFNIKEELNSGVNNLSKSIKRTTKSFINSITILPNIINLFNVFYLPFEYSFVFNLLSTYSIKLSIIYTITYYLVPLILNIILTKIGIKLSLKIISLIVYKDKQSKQELLKVFRAYFYTTISLIIYEIIIILISSNINEYLMAILK